MNYLTEIKLFYDRLETYPLPPAAIALWHALMFTANRCGWPEQFIASIGLLMLRTGLSRSTIYRERSRLREASRIAYRPQGGSADSIYEIHPLEAEFVSRKETQSDAASLFVSHGETQHPAECDFASRDASHRGTRPYRLNRVFTEKEKTSKKEKEAKMGKERKNCAKKRAMPRLNQAQFLSTLDERWREPMSVWLEYKRTRRESYRSELGAKTPCCATSPPTTLLRRWRSSTAVSPTTGRGCSRCAMRSRCGRRVQNGDSIRVRSSNRPTTSGCNSCCKSSTTRIKWDNDLFKQLPSDVFSHDKNSTPHE